MLQLRHIGKYFFKCQNMVLEIQQLVLSMENVSLGIFRDGYVGPNCRDMEVASLTTKRRVRNLGCLKYGLGKTTYLDLAN